MISRPDHVEIGAQLARFNAADVPDARAQLLACCSSSVWADRVLAGRPYAAVGEVLAAADEALAGLTEAEVDEALAGHPRIGQRLTDQHAGFSAAEQAGVTGADVETRRALDRGNAEYEQRFGHVYLVCASGRSAAELLDLLRRRLTNDPVTERAVLRGELAQINRLRLERMLTS